MTSDAIKSMKLYSQVERIHTDLESVGVGRSDPVTVDVLSEFDQLHYFGTDAVDEAIQNLSPSPQASVLDIGSGFGGPARYLADRTGCRVTAVELQPDLDSAASELTRRCGLADRIEHICGDIHAVRLDQDAFDGAISYLALYHIPDRNKVYSRLQTALTPGGRIYVEDLYARRPMTDAQSDVMQHALFATRLPIVTDIWQSLKRRGSGRSTSKITRRAGVHSAPSGLRDFAPVRDRKIALHGEEVVDALDSFYQTICDLFDSGNLGGVRLTARKPG